MNRIWLEFSDGMAYAYCKNCGEAFASTAIADATPEWLAAVRGLDHGCAP